MAFPPKNVHKGHETLGGWHLYMGGVGYIDAIVGKVLTHAPEISAEPNEQQYAVCNDFGVIRRVNNEKTGNRDKCHCDKLYF